MPRWKHHHRHWQHWDDGMRRGWILRWRLQRRIFMTLAAAIGITIGIVMILLRALGIAIHKPPSHFAWGVFVAFLVLWTFSRFMARRIASPLTQLERMARAIGSGNFGERTVDVHISHLRQKLGDDPKGPRLIKTVRGVGYVLSKE